MSDDKLDDLIQAARGLAHMQEHHGAMAETPTILRKCADEIECLLAEIVTIKANALEIFTPNCERHTGDNTPPWDEFVTRTRGVCMLCALDEIVKQADKTERLRVERDALLACRRGEQRCHECPDTQCADNMCPQTQRPDLVSELQDFANTTPPLWQRQLAARCVEEIERLRNDASYECAAEWRDKFRAVSAELERTRDEIADLEDCRERLRELGHYCGCDHVESSDERGVQVRHIREAFARLRADNDRLYAAIRDILASPPAGVSNAVVSEVERLP